MIPGVIVLVFFFFFNFRVYSFTLASKKLSKGDIIQGVLLFLVFM